MEITIEEIQKKFDSLPEELKWAIMAADVDSKIIEIAKKEELNNVQMGQLALETNVVMFGFYPPEKFEESLKGSLGLPDEKIKAIANDVNELILKNIREKLKTGAPVGEETTSEKDDKEILKSAGIEIAEDSVMPTKIPIRTITENREELLKGMEHPELIAGKTPPPMIQSSKLVGSFQIPATKTEYKMDNMTKGGGAPAVATPTVKDGEGALAPKADPYRMPIEE